MNLYLLEQEENCGYDTYDSCVVASPNEATAKTIHPSDSDPKTYVEKDGIAGWFNEDNIRDWDNLKRWDILYGSRDWASSPSSVKCTLIGVAVEGTEQGVVCSSFNAG